MKVDLSWREIEYLLYLINESVSKRSKNGANYHEYSVDDLELMDKLESAMKFFEIEKSGLGKASKNEPLN
ncbi:MAG: hypothetical protein FWF00_06055 [Endomicrobia bacterium]|nr:hypothetical protein [Endomicrobiia bacterium]MCL2507229.1 hypothetical protein [Endomicrobiia bacterium]